MGAKHKFQHANVIVTSSLSREKLLEIGQQATGEFKELIVTQSNEVGFGVTLKNWAKVNLMYFVVTVDDHGDTRTVTTKIHEFKTSQSTIMFIPVGPKELIGYKAYKRYMELLQRSIAAVDPAANATLTERVMA